MRVRNECIITYLYVIISVNIARRLRLYTSHSQETGKNESEGWRPLCQPDPQLWLKSTLQISARGEHPGGGVKGVQDPPAHSTRIHLLKPHALPACSEPILLEPPSCQPVPGPPLTPEANTFANGGIYRWTAGGRLMHPYQATWTQPDASSPRRICL